MIFRELTQKWMGDLRERVHLGDLKPASLATFMSRTNNHILPVFGELEVELVRNGRVKEFAKTVAAKLGPKTTREVVALVKLILESHVDKDGAPILVLQWNNKFIFKSTRKVGKQNQPTISREKLNEILGRDMPARNRVLLTLAAASGMRVGELLAVKVNGGPDSTTWESKPGAIHVRQSLWRGKLQAPKTGSATRQIDLSAEVNALLASFIADAKKKNGEFLFSTRTGAPLDQKYVQRYITEPNEIPGMHSLRRYRASWCEEQNCPRSLLAAWMGHSTESEGITGRYVKSAENRRFRKNWCERISTGLDIIAAPILDQAALETFDEIFAPLTPAEAELEQMRAGAEALC